MENVKKSIAQIKILNADGRTILTKTKAVFNDLLNDNVQIDKKLSPGTNFVQVMVDGEIVTQKLTIVESKNCFQIFNLKCRKYRKEKSVVHKVTGSQIRFKLVILIPDSSSNERTYYQRLKQNLLLVIIVITILCC